MQAAWGILLGRLTGRDDVVFGVTVAGRPPEIAGIETMVGLFINTLPLRVKLPPGQAAARAAAGAAGQPVAADRAPASRAGRDPGPGRTGRAVRHAGGVRELSGRPRRPGGGGRRAAACATSAGTMPTHYPLSLDGGAGRAAAAAARLSARPVRARRASRRWRSGWCGCWRRRWRTPDRAIGSLDILRPRGARTPSCADWNDTARAGPAPRTLPELFAAQVARTPDAVAVVFEEQQPELWRARCARQPAGASSARPRRRARGRGRAVRRALARDGGRAARHPQGRRRLSAARSGLSARAARLHAGGCRRAACWSPRRRCSIGCPPHGAAHRAPRCRLAGHRAPARHRARPSRSTRTTPPTSSTPRARPERPRASWSRISNVVQSGRRQRDCSTLRPTTSWSAFDSIRVRRLDLRDLGTACSVAASVGHRSAMPIEIASASSERQLTPRSGVTVLISCAAFYRRCVDREH